MERGTSLETLAGKGLILREGGTTWFLRLEAEFSNYDGKFRLPLVLTVGRPIFHSNCEGEMEVARVTVGQNRPHLGLCLGHNVPLQG